MRRTIKMGRDFEGGDSNSRPDGHASRTDHGAGQADVVRQRARGLLTIELQPGRTDLLLWEHSVRVARGVSLISRFPELADAKVDQTALTAAAYFHDVGWAMQVGSGDVAPLELLNSPTTELQLELSASAMTAELADALPSRTVEWAGRIIRAVNQRHTEQLETQVLVDADNLDAFGPLPWCLEIRRCLAEGRGLEDVITSWKRRQEYKYWQARISESLRFERSKVLARQRLALMEDFMTGLAAQHNGRDIEQLLTQAVGRQSSG